MTDAVWLQGTLLPRSLAHLDPLAHGFLHGLGIYDSLPLRHGTPVALSRHLRRLSDGAARLLLPAPAEETVRAAIQELSIAHQLTEGRIRITLAAGPSASMQPGPSAENITLITLTPLTPVKASAALTITPFRRNEHSPLAGIKFTACADNILAQRAALAAGYDEAVFLNTAGALCEGAFSNLFLVRHGTVLTPALPGGCLPGVTRETVLALCTAHGIPCAESTLTAEDAARADELFLTSSLRGLQPAHRLDGQELSAPGPVTRRLAALHAAWLDSSTSPI